MLFVSFVLITSCVICLNLHLDPSVVCRVLPICAVSEWHGSVHSNSPTEHGGTGPPCGRRDGRQHRQWGWIQHPTSDLLLPWHCFEVRIWSRGMQSLHNVIWSFSLVFFPFISTICPSPCHYHHTCISFSGAPVLLNNIKANKRLRGLGLRVSTAAAVLPCSPYASSNLSELP